MASASQNLQTAFQFHQAGNFYQAELLYREVLQQQPDNAEAWHLFGVLSHQLGSSDLAVDYISEAIAINPHNPNYYNNLAEAYRGLGNFQTAIENYEKAIQLSPDNARTYANLGLAFEAQAQFEDAIKAFQQALELDPHLASVRNNLGVLFKRQGNFTAALEQYQQAVELQPHYGEAHLNLGTLLQTLGQHEEAIVQYQAAIAAQPYNHSAYNNLGTALVEVDDLEAAIVAYTRAIELKIDFAEAYYNLGNVLQAQGNYPEAIANYEQAMLIAHNWADVPNALGNLYRDRGRTVEAIANYQKALRIEPNHIPAYWNEQLILPILYDTPEEIERWRERFKQGLQDLQTRFAQPEQFKAGIQGLHHTVNFYLQYQGKNDLELQRSYGQLVQQIMAANYPQYAQPIAPRNHLHERSTTSQKIRIGYVSHHLHNHTVAKLFLGWLRHSDREQFEIYCYYTNKKFDAVTQSFQEHCDLFRYIPYDVGATAAQIAADELDVLVFLDIGMEPETTKLAGLRLAPVQCVAWGHPITSGLPTIDYFLTSELMEPADAELHYTEQLIRLPKIGISFPRPQLPSQIKTRAEFGLPEDAKVYLSCQSLYKYLPQYDYIFAAIAQDVPKAKFVFLESPNGEFVTEQFRYRLKKAFAALGLDSEQYCVILPRLTTGDYLSLNLISDVYLDTLGWSGGNTTLEAIACNLPIVTLPSEFMRGRHAYAMLKVLHVDETIAKNAADYIEIAIRLGREAEWRQEITTKMSFNLEHLYDDQLCIRALEEFFRLRVS